MEQTAVATDQTETTQTDISQIDFAVCGKLTTGFRQATTGHINAHSTSATADLLGQRPGLE